MPSRKNPLKLNKLQLRTLFLAQMLAEDPGFAQRDEITGEVMLLRVPDAHGDHLHIGQFTASTREASGLRNPAVWTALVRKGLVRAEGPIGVAMTVKGMSYNTGFGERFLTASDH